MPTRCCWPPESWRGKLASRPFEADQLDHLARARFSALGRQALHLQREGHIVEHGQMRQQAEMLEHHAHLVAAELDQLALASPAAGPGRRT